MTRQRAHHRRRRRKLRQRAQAGWLEFQKSGKLGFKEGFCTALALAFVGTVIGFGTAPLLF